MALLHRWYFKATIQLSSCHDIESSATEITPSYLFTPNTGAIAQPGGSNTAVAAGHASLNHAVLTNSSQCYSCMTLARMSALVNPQHRYKWFRLCNWWRTIAIASLALKWFWLWCHILIMTLIAVVILRNVVDNSKIFFLQWQKWKKYIFYKVGETLYKQLPWNHQVAERW